MTPTRSEVVGLALEGELLVNSVGFLTTGRLGNRIVWEKRVVKIISLGLVFKVLYASIALGVEVALEGTVLETHGAFSERKMLE